jgi:predicted metal-dependent peptidase
MNQLKIDQIITQQRVAIMRDPRFSPLAGILMIGKWEVIDNFPTAATNGHTVIYGGKFMEGLDNATRRFVVLHEYYHIMLMHMTNLQDLFQADPQTANIAADMVINLMLDKQAGSKSDGFIKVWEHAALDYKYDGLDTREVYRRLKQQQGGKGKAGGSGQGKPGVRSAGGGEAQQFDEHQQPDAQGQTIKDALTPEQVKELQQQIDTALRQGAQMAGRMGGALDRSITDLLEVVVNWEEELQDFVRTHAAGNDLSTWRKPSRRWMARDIYQPSRYSEAAKRITIGCDTSGSIGEEQLRRAMTEIKSACDTVHPEMVDVIYWDYDVAGHEKYEGDAIASIADVTKPKGGGGTRVGSMLAYMNKEDIKPDCIIIFTDGYVEQDWGGNNWPAPVLWCVSTKGLIAPFGKTLYVPAHG